MTLIAFDFDGTLSDSEMTVLLGERAGVADEMARITERAMNDEIGYAESLRDRADLLADLSDAEAAAAFDEVRLRPGAGAVIDDLRAAGHHVAILTGGFDRGVAAALSAADTAVDTVVANELPVADEALTGEVTGPLIEGTKDDALASLAADLGTTVDEAVAVGDGANDLPMLEVAGLAVGYDPKPAVAPACDTVVTDVDELAATLRGEALFE
ncbi:phosphoserine phosphatase SerB [Halobaculum sp. MBLA0143]|uniref:phosphoserine phosphatase SerB n=1 Tax=Halobaculum sp. MBLA0143 TaxID=3079933 RepID=UPI003526A8B3